MNQTTIYGGWADVVMWHLVAGLLYGGLFLGLRGHRPWLRATGVVMALGWVAVTLLAHRETVIVMTN